jgi:hypothetical protein
MPGLAKDVHAELAIHGIFGDPRRVPTMPIGATVPDLVTPAHD